MDIRIPAINSMDTKRLLIVLYSHLETIELGLQLLEIFGVGGRPAGGRINALLNLTTNSVQPPLLGHAVPKEL
jgi:hypothetical protein